jgi:ABC-2 type transport system permease protein
VFSSRSRAVAGTATRLLLADPAPLMVTVLMPLLLTAFLMPSTRAQLRLEGFAHASGGEQLVPGLAVMFAFVNTTLVGTLFFREHAWGTWDRLRASPASTLEIVAGKVFPLYVCELLQLGVLFGLGRLLFGYRPTGSLLALAAVLVLFVALVVALGVMLVALFATMDQALVIGNLGGILMAGLGGSLAPATSLPGWAQAIAHVTPTYWTLKALRDITLNGAGLAHVAPALAVVAGFTMVFALVAALRFRPGDPKVGTT